MPFFSLSPCHSLSVPWSIRDLLGVDKVVVVVEGVRDSRFERRRHVAVRDWRGLKFIELRKKKNSKSDQSPNIMWPLIFSFFWCVVIHVYSWHVIYCEGKFHVTFSSVTNKIFSYSTALLPLSLDHHHHLHERRPLSSPTPGTTKKGLRCICFLSPR